MPDVLMYADTYRSPELRHEVPIGIPPTFKDFTLHQFTDGHNGPEPHNTGGRPCDRNRFKGTEKELKQQWPFAA